MKDIGTLYFEGEGRPWMKECIHRAADWCVSASLNTLVMFTGTGEGPHYAATEMLLRDRYKHLKIVAVTPAVGRLYKANPSDPNSPLVAAGINPAMRDALERLDIRVVSAHLPFKDLYGHSRGSEWATVAEAYGVLGGGFALCVQAVLLACDAGWVSPGQDVVALSADTAIVTTACRTESFLSPTEGLLVGHIICRPGRYNISKQRHEKVAPPSEEPAPAIPSAEPAAPARSARLTAPGLAQAEQQSGSPRPERRRRRIKRGIEG